jgi:HTH-type transcriptional regulator / antitoxin HigA
MSKELPFRPDWSSPPGETILDILRERGLALHEFARLMAYPADNVRGLIDGSSPITIGVARQLERVVGASVEFWMSRDFQFREDVSRLEMEWLARTPVKDMIALGWIDRPASASDYAGAVLSFFGLANYQMWRQKYAAVRELVAFRTSPTFQSQPAAVAAWLRRGELEAERIECQRWDATRFKESLTYLRQLTRRKDPQRFQPELERVCADCGVAVVIVRAPSGCHASGATWFASDDKGILMLSARYLTNDQFWFTFFHEAGHLVLHGDHFFLEGSTTFITREEGEANAFASDMLIPPAHQVAFRSLPRDPRAVIRFAIQIGIAPGLVVGQMQHHKMIRYNQFNRLKRRFRWT